jgi:hypothetical protein
MSIVVDTPNPIELLATLLRRVLPPKPEGLRLNEIFRRNNPIETAGVDLGDILPSSVFLESF